MNSLYQSVIDRLIERASDPLREDDEATAHVAIAQLYEELKLFADAGHWYARAAQHCESRGRADLQRRYLTAASLMGGAPLRSTEPGPLAAAAGTSNRHASTRRGRRRPPARLKRSR